MQAWIAIALVGNIVSANIPPAPNWQPDYQSAKVRAKDVQRPLAVFIGSGKEGWSRLTQDGTFDSKVGQMLAQKYICIYADRSTAEGRRLAEAFEVTGTAGLVISDKSGSLQAYHHNGELSSRDLIQTLEKYGDPERLVQQTDADAPVRKQPTYYSPTVLPYRSFGGG